VKANAFPPASQQHRHNTFNGLRVTCTPMSEPFRLDGLRLESGKHRVDLPGTGDNLDEPAWFVQTAAQCVEKATS
jgi:hypothetical protein